MSIILSPMWTIRQEYMKSTYSGLGVLFVLLERTIGCAKLDVKCLDRHRRPRILLNLPHSFCDQVYEHQPTQLPIYSLFKLL